MYVLYWPDGTDFSEHGAEMMIFYRTVREVYPPGQTMNVGLRLPPLRLSYSLVASFPHFSGLFFDG